MEAGAIDVKVNKFNGREAAKYRKVRHVSDVISESASFIQMH